MKALTFDPQSEQFSVSDLPVPEVGGADVLIQVDACGLNPVDAKIRLWQRMAPGMDASWVPGLDVAGTIVAMGDAVTNWKLGDRVLCHGNMFRPHGGFAEYTVQDSETLVPHPDLPASVAAATPCAGWTAWRALVDKLRIDQAVDSIFITGGSGGVGSFATQIAAYFKVPTLIASCSTANIDTVRALGARHVIDYRQENVVERVLEITQGEGVAAGLDTVGPDNDLLVANSLRFEGQMVELVDTVRPKEYADAFMKGLSFHQLSLGAGHRNGPRAKAELVAAGTAFSKLVEQGALRVPKLQTIPLEAVGDALSEMLKQRTVGKVVMELR